MTDGTMENSSTEKVQAEHKRLEIEDALYSFCLRALSEKGTEGERALLPQMLAAWLSLAYVSTS